MVTVLASLEYVSRFRVFGSAALYITPLLIHIRPSSSTLTTLQSPQTKKILALSTSNSLHKHDFQSTSPNPTEMGACFSRPLTGDEPCEWRCAYHYGCAHPIALDAQNGPETRYARRLLKENDPYTRIYMARGYGEIPHDWAHELAPIVAAGGVVTLPGGVRVGREGVVGGGQ